MAPESDRTAKRMFTTVMQKACINLGRMIRQGIQRTYIVVCKKTSRRFSSNFFDINILVYRLKWRREKIWHIPFPFNLMIYTSA